MSAPADSGLQAERTALSWRRTALAVAVGSLLGLRVLPSQLGTVGYAVSALGLAWSLDLAVTARRRYRDGSRLVRAVGRDDGVGGHTTAAPTLARTAGSAAVFALAALGCIVVLVSR